MAEMLNVGATVMGVDTDTPLDIANEILGRQYSFARKYQSRTALRSMGSLTGARH